MILGEIASVSSDRLSDEATHQPYYLDGYQSTNWIFPTNYATVFVQACLPK